MMDRHFCVTIYVYNPVDNSFLMMDHKKLKKWLPPGGHIEENETPESAAVRECLEETGINIEILGKTEAFEGSMKRPLGIQLNVIVQGEHEHLDILYLASPTDKKIAINYLEATNVSWIAIDEILDKDFNTFPSVKHWCEKIYKNYETLL